MYRQYRKLFTYILILLAAFSLLFIPQKRFAPFKLFVVKVITIPVKLINIPVYEIKKILYYHRTFDEWMKLREEVDVLKSRLVGLEEVVRENTRLEKLLDFKRNLIFSSVMANVVGRDPANWNASVIIDKGKDHGIGEGMPVVTALGVVGKIAEVDNNTSRVILLTDPQFSVPALVQRPRETGLLSGSLQGTCRLRYLSSEANIEIGDKVITSKLSTSFPEGLIIGDITSISVINNSELEYVVNTAVAVSKLEEVIVIQK